MSSKTNCNVMEIFVCLIVILLFFWFVTAPPCGEKTPQEWACEAGHHRHSQTKEPISSPTEICMYCKVEYTKD